MSEENMRDAESLAIGKVTKPHGLNGEVRVQYFGNDPDSLMGIKDAWIVKENGSRIDLKIKKIRAAKNVLIIGFCGVDSIDDTGRLLGGNLHVKRGDLAELDEDEYYWGDLIGIEVYSESGERLGTLDSILETGGNDVYVVKSGLRELLLPAISKVIKKVDVSNKRMTVRLLEGMRDDL